MKRTEEDNTVSVIQRAIKHFRISVTKNSVKEELKSHVNYPTFKSICDTLNEWKIENYPLKYQPDEMKELTAPYIVHFNGGGGQLAFVSRIRNQRVTYYDSYNSKKETGFKEFTEKCSGAVILLNPDEKSGEEEYRKKWQDELIGNSILPVTIVALLLFISLTIIKSLVGGGLLLHNVESALLLTKTTGIALSILLILHEYDVDFFFTEKICHLNKATNCNTVLNDKSSKIFGWFGWADASLVYFTSCFLFLLLGSRVDNYSLMAILSALSLPYPVFSIYFQGVVLKKWCPMCLGVQIILITEFILLLPMFPNLSYSFNSLSNLILTFLIIGIIYTLVILSIRERTSNEIHYYKYLGFKKNPIVLRTLMLNQLHYKINVNERSLFFGEKDAPLIVTAFLSLQCSHCARAFEKIKDIIKSDMKVGINVILITQDENILNALYHFYKSKRDDEALALLDQWYNMESFSKSKLSENLCIPEVVDVSEDVNNQNLILYKSCNINGTPTFLINGYLLPRQYDIDDIKYFEEFFKEQEILI